MAHLNDIGTRRLTRELMSLRRDPLKCPKIVACPLESNILEWHYVIEGSTGSPYEGGFYHGKLIFPKEYPLKPPGVIMCTPSGRFVTNRRLCLSMSDFHPESWNPMWSVSTILTGLYSFMLDTHPTSGSIETTTLQKKKYALQTLDYNVRDKNFCNLFPDLVEYHKEQLKNRPAPQQKLSQAQAQNQTNNNMNIEFLPGDFNTLLAAAATLVALVSIVMAMFSYFL
jgi:ubiquitin-conjugating enzyme E2 J2